MGEKAPYEDTSFTDGICSTCKPQLLVRGIMSNLERLQFSCCRICSFSNRQERAFFMVTHEIEFPRERTPDNKKIVVCKTCYDVLKTYRLLVSHWESEARV